MIWSLCASAILTMTRKSAKLGQLTSEQVFPAYLEEFDVFEGLLVYHVQDFDDLVEGKRRGFEGLRVDHVQKVLEL